jgi:hypothetical protein
MTEETSPNLSSLFEKIKKTQLGLGGTIDASTKRPQTVFILSIKSSLNDSIPEK